MQSQHVRFQASTVDKWAKILLGISCVNVELKTETSKISIIWADVLNDLHHWYICQSVTLMPHSLGIQCNRSLGVKLCGHTSGSHLSPCHTGVPVVNYCVFFLARSFLCSCALEFPNIVVLGFHALPSLNLWPFIMSAVMLETKEISETLLLTQHWHSCSSGKILAQNVQAALVKTEQNIIATACFIVSILLCYRIHTQKSNTACFQMVCPLNHKRAQVWPVFITSDIYTFMFII
jgi:hypothetical protein